MARKALLGNLSDTDLRLLRVFRSVAACGGFAAAELELNINRSTISRHIKDLETRLGVTLCRRGRGGFALSSEGEQVLASAQRMMGAMEDFRHEVNELQQRLTGSLVMAMFDKTATNPRCHISRALARFDELAPDVHLQLHVQPINAIEAGVMEGRYHLGIIPTHRHSSSLDYFRLFDEQMYLYCGQSHPLFNPRPDQLDPSRCAVIATSVSATTPRIWRSPANWACSATPPPTTRRRWPTWCCRASTLVSCRSTTRKVLSPAA